MLSFILFIVPIFLIYLLPPLSLSTSSCSCRLQDTKKGEPMVARSTASQHPYLGIFKPLYAPQVSDPLVKS